MEYKRAVYEEYLFYMKHEQARNVKYKKYK